MRGVGRGQCEQVVKAVKKKHTQRPRIKEHSDLENYKLLIKNEHHRRGKG